MQPIQIFALINEELCKKPSSFWDKKIRKQLLSQAVMAVAALKETLEKQDLTQTPSYVQLTAIQKSLSPDNFQEVSFIQALSVLMDIYLAAAKTPEQTKNIRALISTLQKAGVEIFGYHLLLERLATRAQTMDEAERNKSDIQTIKKIGLFYVVENLLRVLVELEHATDEMKWILLKKGMKTKTYGQIPAYLVLEEEDRNKLCYYIFDEAFRDELLRLFYIEEEIIRTKELKPICLAIKQLTIDLLRAFQKKGLTKYRGIIYSPFGNDIPVDDLILKIKQINF